MPTPLDTLKAMHQQNYSDMPFEQFTSKVHAKYYSDIPFADFTDKLGLTVPNEPVDNSPAPMAPIEGSSPWEAGQLPTKAETKPYVRAAAQIVAGVPTMFANPLAAGAVTTLAGMGVDAAYGDMSPASEYAKEAAFTAGIPAVGGIVWKYGKDYIRNGLNQAAKRIYQSGAKFLPSLGTEARDRITTTALQNKILPQSQKSLDELGSTINAIDYAVEGAFKARNSIDGVPTGDIKKSFHSMIEYYQNNKIFGPQVAEELRSKLKYLDELPDYIKPNQALTMRREINKDLRGFFKRANTAGATPSESGMTQALAGMRGELNQSLYGMFPELRQVGKQEASYIMLQQHLERTMNRLNNSNLLPLSAIIAGSAVGGIVGGVSGDYKTGTAGGLGTALAIAVVGSPNMKARVAFALARAGGLADASASTLQLLNLTRERATTLEPKMKALPFPRTMGSGKPDISGIVKGGQEVVHAEESNAYENLWRKYANRNEGQFETIPNPPPARNLYGPEEWTPSRTNSDYERALKEYGTGIFDRINRGYLGETILHPAQKSYLGIPYEALDKNLFYRGKKLK